MSFTTRCMISMGQGLPDFILKVSDKSRRVV